LKETYLKHDIKCGGRRQTEVSHINKRNETVNIRLTWSFEQSESKSSIAECYRFISLKKQVVTA